MITGPNLATIGTAASRQAACLTATGALEADTFGVLSCCQQANARFDADKRRGWI